MSDKQPDLRFNNRELIGIFIMLIVVSSLIFGLGVFVGKGMSETKALLFLKEQFKKEQIAQMPALDTNKMGTVPSPSTPDTERDEGIRSPSEDDKGKEEDDDGGDEYEGEPYGTGTGNDDSKLVPDNKGGTPVAPRKQIRSGGLDNTLGLTKKDVDEVLLDGGRNVPYKSEMAKIYKGDSPLFTIVLLNTTDRQRAENLVRSLSGELSGVYMDAREVEGGSSLVYRVLLGKYRSKGEAKSFAIALRDEQKINRYSVQMLD
ncbi:MAG: hypothetical protein A3F16_01515 [Deltaproteobacteria bacterium RIFCSPHIGHO2_12_FULL_43_9]|nr:MAG: hypothetical protein A3F16_01515 [Deltaproteobacteria bacterium RIFCSPHIGHO2_12_FULL_43_9]